MEVNADDMVIICNSKEEMVVDIKETLERIQVINLKLDPNKCSFRVEERRFSRHLIIKQGIKADPSKVKALLDLQPPKSVSEIQSLCKKIKEILEALPTMTAPFNCKALIVCLAASEEFVSAVLMAERGKKQVHVYFVSQTLHGAKLEYPELEKTHIGPRICRKKAAKIFPSSPHPGAAQAEDIIQEVHQGSCRMHSGSRSVVSKIRRTTTNSTRRRKVPSSGHLLLHKIGQSKATNINDKEAHGMAHSLSFVKNSEYSKPSHQSTTPKANGQFSLWLGSCNLDRDKCRNKKNPRFDPKKNEKRHMENLDILEERREVTSIKEADYKQKLERCYNKRVRSSTFKPGMYVPRLNSASKAEFQGKMRPTWEGPYVVKKAYGDGAYKLEMLSGSLIDRTWNRSNLRKFYV
nr:reverse transcriptase domain-containing protein [Tanacetum cinerariifolium]